MGAIYPPSLTFWQAMQKGYVRPIRCGAYLDYVRALPCVLCGGSACAHHLVGHGLKPVGGKVSDYLSFPLCNPHHSPQAAGSLHHLGHDEWERQHGDQRVYVFQTLVQAIHDRFIAIN